MFYFCFFFVGYVDHRVLHLLTHYFPTRRSSYLASFAAAACLGVPYTGVIADAARPSARDLARWPARTDVPGLFEALPRRSLRHGAFRWRITQRKIGRAHV